MTGDFYDRFPSAKPKPKPKPAPATDFDARARELLPVLEAALPLLRQHANHEPFAIPVRVHKGRRVDLVAGWVLSSWLSKGNSEMSRSGAGNDDSWQLSLLLEDGRVGYGSRGTQAGEIAGTWNARRLSFRGIRRAHVIVEAKVAAQSLEKILTEAGHPTSLT